MKKTLLLAGVVGCIVGSCMGYLGVSLKSNTVAPSQTSLQKAFQKLDPITVSISGTLSDTTGTISREGTGIIVGSDGKILTSRHIISEGFIYTVRLYDGTLLYATVDKIHPTRDIALLSITGNEQKKLPTGDIIHSQENIQPGTLLVSLGNALGNYPNSFTLGMISGINRAVSFGGVSMTGLIQTTLPMSLGNSGGPVSILDGRIIGITTGIVGGGSQVSWVLPLTQNEVDDFMNS